MSRPRTLNEVRALPWFQRQWHSYRIYRRLDALYYKQNPLLNAQINAFTTTNFLSAALIWGVVIHRLVSGASTTVPGSLAGNLLDFSVFLLFIGFAVAAPLVFQVGGYRRFMRDHVNTVV